jgi:hypothetical protein
MDALQVSIPAAGRLYAMTMVTMYDAVNGIDWARHLSTRARSRTDVHERQPESAQRTRIARDATVGGDR